MPLERQHLNLAAIHRSRQIPGRRFQATAYEESLLNLSTLSRHSASQVHLLQADIGGHALDLCILVPSGTSKPRGLGEIGYSA